MSEVRLSLTSQQGDVLARVISEAVNQRQQIVDELKGKPDEYDRAIITEAEDDLRHLASLQEQLGSANQPLHPDSMEAAIERYGEAIVAQEHARTSYLRTLTSAAYASYQEALGVTKVASDDLLALRQEAASSSLGLSTKRPTALPT